MGEASVWRPDDRVLVVGLVGRPELNDRAGAVICRDRARGRFAVQLDGNPLTGVEPECVLLKPVNMRAQTAADGSGWLPTVATLQAEAHMHEAERLRATGQDPGRAVAAAILAAAEAGDAEAQFGLAKLSLGAAEDGRETGAIEAFSWLRRAAELGHVAAQHNLGLCYEQAKGCVADPVSSLAWFQRAAFKGYPASCRQLGMMHDRGINGATNPQEAVRWYRRAAESDDAEAAYNLGVCYHLGSGVAQSDLEAARWYRVAADLGDGHAQSNLAISFERGQGVPKNLTEAVRFYRLAAAQGVTKACSNLGFNLLHGRGTAVDAVEAVRYLRQAVAQGSKRAMCNLAYCYGAGLGVEKSLERARKLLQDASSPGYVASSTGMGRSEGPEPAQLDYARAMAAQLELSPLEDSPTSPPVAPQPALPPKPESICRARVDDFQLEFHCATCGASVHSGIKLRRCQGCNVSWYCGNKCQKKAWKRLGHRTRCGAAAPTRQSITRADAAEAVAVLREWHGVHSILPLVALYRVSKLCDDGGSAMQLLTDEDLFKASVLVMQAHPWAADLQALNADVICALCGGYTPEAMARRQLAAEAGVLEATVLILRTVGLEDAQCAAASVVLAMIVLGAGENNDARARQLRAVECGGLEATAAAMRAYPEHEMTQIHGCMALGNLCWGQDDAGLLCKVRAAAVGSLDAVVTALAAHPQSAELQAAGALALVTLTSGTTAQNIECKQRASDCGASRHLAAAIRAHVRNQRVAEEACSAIATIAVGSDSCGQDNARCGQAAADAGALEAAILAMRSHPESEMVQYMACSAVNNICTSSEVLRQRAVALGAIEEVVQAMRRSAKARESKALANLVGGEVAGAERARQAGANESWIEMTHCMAGRYPHEHE